MLLLINPITVLGAIALVAWLGTRDPVRSLLVREPPPSRLVSAACIALLFVGGYLILQQLERHSSDQAWLIVVLAFYQFVIVGIGFTLATVLPGTERRASAIGSSLLLMAVLGILNCGAFVAAGFGWETDREGHDFRGPMLWVAAIVAGLTLVLIAINRLPVPSRNAARWHARPAR